MLHGASKGIVRKTKSGCCTVSLRLLTNFERESSPGISNERVGVCVKSRQSDI